MPGLVDLRLLDIQRNLHRSILAGDVRSAVGLTGGRFPHERLAIHLRHYEATLVSVIIGKFPGAEWLVGTSYLTQAATQFVHERPPSAPCIAEYGWDFPAYLATCPGSDRVPYLRDFAELEVRVGLVSIAVTEPAVPVSSVSPQDWPITRLNLQSGVHYLATAWPVDELLQVFLSDAAPEALSLEQQPAHLEIRGARGEFRFQRLTAGDFIFRKSLRDGHAMGTAAEAALEQDDLFHPDQAFAELLSSSLVTSISTTTTH